MHIINDKYHKMTHLLLVLSRHYRLHSRVPQLDLLDGHASDRECTHAILSTLMIKLTETIIYFCKTNVGTSLKDDNSKENVIDVVSLETVH